MGRTAAKQRNKKPISQENLDVTYRNAIKEAFKQGAPKTSQKTHFYENEPEYQSKRIIKIRTTPIVWGVPMDEYVFSKFFTIYWKNANVMPWDDIATTESTYLPDARNQIHETFRVDCDYPLLMMLDSDVLIPSNMVERLISHNLPIVGGWYKNKNRLQKYEPHPIVYDFLGVNEKNGHVNWKHRDKPGQGLERVDGMGAGCWLMTREVAEALGPRPYDMAGGTEDLKISKKLMDLGIPLHVDWDVECPHMGVSWV